MSWICTKCGACCRKAESILGNLDVGFPYDFNQDGSCEMYDSEKGCIVYESRPSVCRMDLVAKITIEWSDKTEEQFYDETTIACNAMMDELNIDNSFRIK